MYKKETKYEPCAHEKTCIIKIPSINLINFFAYKFEHTYNNNK